MDKSSILRCLISHRSRVFKALLLVQSNREWDLRVVLCVIRSVPIVIPYSVVINGYIHRYSDQRTKPWIRYFALVLPRYRDYLTKCSLAKSACYLAVIVGQPLPLLPFSARKNMLKGKDNGNEPFCPAHAIPPASSGADSNCSSTSVLPHFQSPGRPKASSGVGCVPHSARW